MLSSRAFQGLIRSGSGPLAPRFRPLLDLTDFKRDLSELTDRLGHAQDCL
jgi:hypothetical protein